MSICLNDARVQAVADGEATESERDHARACSRCRVRVSDAQDAIGEFARAMAAVPMPRLVESRVMHAVAHATSERRGATTLRATPSALRVRPAWAFAAVAVAAVLAILFVVFPSVDPGTRLNASEILGRSLQTLAVRGIESLKYDLTIDAPGAPSAETGRFLIEQLIDHDTGRWRFARFASDGTLLTGIAEDPAANIRVVVIRQDGRTFRFHFRLTPDERLPLWDLQRRYAEAVIRLVQASGAQVVSTDVANGHQRYVVELPEVVGAGAPSLFDLHRARVMVDATDFHIIEFSAAGEAVGQRVTIAYQLLERSVWASPAPGVSFDLARDPDTIDLQGNATQQIAGDLFSLLLREVARSRR